MDQSTAEGALVPFHRPAERGVAGSLVHNFATREGAAFVKLEAICAIREYVQHDSGGKKFAVLCLDSGEKIETSTPITEVLTILKW